MRRNTHLDIRCTTEEKQRLQQAAQARGMNLSKYILSKTLEENLYYPTHEKNV